jgi:hypothetical protein
MRGSFRDALTTLVAAELLNARSAKDEDRGAGVVADLGEQLGKAIAIISDGDTRTVDLMLSGSEGFVATVAVETTEQLLKINHFFRKGERI